MTDALFRELACRDLGCSPDTNYNLNGGSFQQDVLVTHRGWQYVAFFRDANIEATRHICLGRRNLPGGDWDIIEFEDHNQVEDDGHNVVCLGISTADGVIHLSFDNHDTPLNYKYSLIDLTSKPNSETWKPSSFSHVLHYLPGLEITDSASVFHEMTYPRFVSLPNPPGSLMLEYRTGVSGLGNDHMFVYHPNSKKWIYRGIYLQGVGNNPYVNGVDVDAQGVLHVSWCYRDYVPVTLEQSRQQAGPNGPENNHDLCYAYSPPENDGSGPGLNWFSYIGTQVGQAGKHPILPDTPGILAFEIPKFSGVLNQEGQCIDQLGNFYVLNREILEGTERWFIYCLSLRKSWSKLLVPAEYLPNPPSKSSARGKIFVSSNKDVLQSPQLFAILPLQQDLYIIGIDIEHLLSATGQADNWTVAKKILNAGVGARYMEPLYDKSSIHDGILSLFLGVREEGKDHLVMRVVDLLLRA